MNVDRGQSLVTGCIPGWAERPTPEPPYEFGVLLGGGVGPEVIGAALEVLDAAAERCGIAVAARMFPDVGPPGPYGPELTADVERSFAAELAAGNPVLCGPVGGRFVYELRHRFELYCKFVPIRPTPALADAAIVRPDLTSGTDVLVVRENVAGLYLGEFGRRDSDREAYQVLSYTEEQVDRVLEVALRAARERRGLLTVVTKNGGIPEVSNLWRERAEKGAAETGIELEEIEIDNACFQLVAAARRFDVMVAPNMLGDVLADAGTLVLGSRGMSLSANFGTAGKAVYQTGHGLARDLAGTDKANPVAQTLSLAMLLRENFRLEAAAALIEDAVERTLARGYRTPDIAGPSSTVLGTKALADRIALEIAEPSVDRG